MPDHGGRRHGRLADANHRNIQQLAAGFQARIVETGDDQSIDTIRGTLAGLLQQAGQAIGLIVVAFDTDGPVRRIDGNDLRARRGNGARGLTDLVRHGSGCVRIDNEDFHDTD